MFEVVKLCEIFLFVANAESAAPSPKFHIRFVKSPFDESLNATGSGATPDVWFAPNTAFTGVYTSTFPGLLVMAVPH